jgi:hypothetical protein
MSAMQSVESPPHGWTYGRRKVIPVFVVLALLSASRVAIGHDVMFNLVGLVLCAVGVWRYWSEPMPARLAQRIARNDGTQRFGHLLWHKVALGVLVIVGVPFGILIVFATLGSR